jgi:hypothetical protein
MVGPLVSIEAEEFHAAVHLDPRKFSRLVTARKDTGNERT